MDFKEAVHAYQIRIYALLIVLSGALTYISGDIPWPALQSFAVSLSASLASVAVLFFLINVYTPLRPDRSIVKVVLSNGSRSQELPFELRRSEFTRSELLGIIGMIPMKENGKRFSLKYLNNPDLLTEIHRIRDHRGNSKLTIPCDNEEFGQFEFT